MLPMVTRSSCTRCRSASTNACDVSGASVADRTGAADGIDGIDGAALMGRDDPGPGTAGAGRPAGGAGPRPAPGAGGLSPPGCVAVTPGPSGGARTLSEYLRSAWTCCILDAAR